MLHDGPQLLLIDLGAHGRPTRSAHRALILAADGLTVLVLIASAVLLIRRKPGARIGYDQTGSSINGDVADYR